MKIIPDVGLNRMDKKKKNKYYLDLIERFQKAFPELKVVAFDPGIVFSYLEEFNTPEGIKPRIVGWHTIPVKIAEYLITKTMEG
jgi:hypothetical protein